MFSKVTVYLGSAAGNSPVYADNAAEFGRRLAQAGVEIVYGGASVGTMWTMASAAIQAGGRVTGVFPKNFKGKKESQDRRIEVRAQGLAEMIETPDLASRVAKMTELSQACIVLPGSYGTMHELFCWLLGHQLREHGSTPSRCSSSIPTAITTACAGFSRRWLPAASCPRPMRPYRASAPPSMR